MNIPCQQATGAFEIIPFDAFNNRILTASCNSSLFAVRLTNNQTLESFPGVVSWSRRDASYLAQFVVSHGGFYNIFIDCAGIPLNFPPIIMAATQPSPNASVLTCQPKDSTVFQPYADVLCLLSYADMQSLPITFCSDTINCTIPTISSSDPHANTTVSPLQCVNAYQATFSWQLGGGGSYQVHILLYGQTMAPFQITLQHSSDRSWWDHYGWYVIGAIGILVVLLSSMVGLYVYHRIQRQRKLEHRYELLGADFMNVPANGKMMMTLWSLIQDSSIRKVDWSQVVPFSTAHLPTSSSQTSSLQNSNEFSKQDLLGKGASGKVWKAYFADQPVAVKLIYIQGSDEETENIREFFNEIKTLATLNHPNILQFIGIAVISFEECEIALLTELMECSIDKLIFTPMHYETLTMMNKLQWSLDIVQGIAYLHHCTPPIIHRDIKPENVLLSPQGVAKLCDFGISTFRPNEAVARSMTQKIGTPAYFSPEVFESDQYTESADIYSLGVLYCELFSGERAYSQPDLAERGMANILYMIVHEALRPLIDPSLPRSLQNLIQEMLEADPKNRPDSFEIVMRLQRTLSSI